MTRFFEYIKTTGFSRYFQIEGRASRREMWYWLFFSLFITLGLPLLLGGALLSLIFISIFFGNIALLGFMLSLLGTIMYYVTYAIIVIYGVYALIPSITLSIRRFHDINMSGWFVLLHFVPLIEQIILFVLNYCIKGTQGENDYGAEAVYAKEIL